MSGTSFAMLVGIWLYPRDALSGGAAPKEQMKNVYIFTTVEDPMSLPRSKDSSGSVPVVRITVGGDRFSSEVECSSLLLIRVLNWYLTNVRVCAEHNASVATTVRNVVRFATSPQALLEPGVVARVLAAALSRRMARNRAERLDAAVKGAF
jgi:hypothetical protein